MKGLIKFYHPDETLVYHIRKCFCKVVFLNMKNTLVVEIESDDDLDHVEEDSYQNEYPQVSFSIEDFEIPVKTIQQLCGKSFQIPSYEEKENENGEVEELYYTNLNINDEEDLETDNNELKFGKDEQGNLKLIWQGYCEDFITQEEPLRFKVSCSFINDILEIDE
ncbi:hypothetical protein [Apibacter sp. wkB309]|uniref:hypothetical protein n=1 Tax=Apibacter sp. wkB309 TaxID=1679467 RepID=UPI000CF9F2C1|nr:hypothetical protein [Apibacter sp. wkB309]PQL92820.1 hypothetical protein C4S75_00650 [Apibacter sp. wkB309]